MTYAQETQAAYALFFGLMVTTALVAAVYSVVAWVVEWRHFNRIERQRLARLASLDFSRVNPR